MTTERRPLKRARTNENMPAAVGVDGVNGVAGEHQTSGVKENPSVEEWFVGSIDQGTTSSRFIIFNSEADIVASHQIEFENIYPESG